MDNESLNPDVSRAAIESVVRENYGKILSTLIAQFKDVEFAEDCLQEAISSALSHWGASGIPVNPVAWVITVAKRKAIDMIRRDSNFAKKRELLQAVENESTEMVIDEETIFDEEIPDERLRLIFTCCHPSLSESARIALTLKTLCGLSTLQIANAFLVKEKAIAQRLVRAKKKIKLAGIPYAVPLQDQWDERMASVMTVIYLIFNEGYHSVSDEKILQVDLCLEGMQIGAVLVKLLPAESEAMGLLALMYLHYARFPARLDKQGASASLREQDRGLWLKDYIIAGDKHLKAALMKGKLGAYQIQAAISAVHTHALNFEQTDWQQITLLYEKLYQYKPSPVVELNAAVALSFAQNPEAGLVALESIENGSKLMNYQPYYAAKADMLRRADKDKEARKNYSKAIKLTKNQADKAWLQRQLASL